jgi:DNA polymerase III delta prime subunit
LLERLEPVKAGYDLDRRCMEGTRQSILNQIMVWVADSQEMSNGPRSNAYWFYGSPGIGKTSLAHSICARLHDREQLAGAFFCRRDDPSLSKHRNILPTLISKLAGIFPPFRTIVVNRLRNDPNLSPESMKGSLFLDFIHDVARQPERALVFVIDALDECGDDQSRPVLLKVLIDAASHVPWLKIILISRPEDDIQCFFNSLPRSSYLSHDLATNHEASVDLRTFARREFGVVARKWCLSTPWPEESLFDGVIERAGGLFIFIRTIVLDLEHCEDPTEHLKEALQGSAGTGLKPLYVLYSSVLKTRVLHGKADFRQVIGVLLTTAPYRPLCEEALAELAGVKPNLVKKWVNDLSSLLYRDEAANGGIRVRHLSISDFFFSDHCAYQVIPRNTNVELGIACLKTMVKQLRFNICRLEDSRLANSEVQDLPSRIKENISDTLQYSSLYWSNHLCFTPDTGDLRVWETLCEFFGGLYGLFWVEVLSLMRMVSIGAPSLRRVISWAKVSTPPVSVCISGCF